MCEGTLRHSILQMKAARPISIKVTGETHTMKKFIAIFVALSLFTILTAASCSGTGGGGSTGTGTSVHMGETTFTQSSVTISKGSSLTLIDDVPVTHIISNGSWADN